MPQRAPIERWNRAELEDRFHSIADEVKSLKQSNTQLRKDMKIINGRVVVGGRGMDGPSREEENSQIDQLQRSKQVLAQKLKVLKHQLLSSSYAVTVSRPRPTTSGTARPSTGAGTSAERTAAPIGRQNRRQQQRPLPPSTLRRRPQSATAAEERSAVGRRSAEAVTAVDPALPSTSKLKQPRIREAPASAGGIMEKTVVPKGEDMAERQIVGMRGGTTAAATMGNQRRPTNEWMEEIEPVEIGDGRRRSNDERNGIRWRDLQRQNRTAMAENEELRFSLDKNEQKLSTLRREYDRIASELEITRKELRSQSDSLSSFREETQRKSETNTKSAEISTRELAILREECQSLKIAHDRLVARSLEEENSGKTVLDELSRLRAQLQQNSSESEAERREFEGIIQRLRAKNARLERELEMIETGRRNREPIEDLNGERDDPEENGELSRNSNGRNHQQEEGYGGNPKHNPMGHYGTLNNGRNARESEPTLANSGDAMLNKLFSDVMAIVESHIGPPKNGRTGAEEHGMNNGTKNGRWEQMYEDVYGELEKVRRLLLSEHEMNTKMREQMHRMAAENEDMRKRYEERLAAMRKELEERGTQMGMLERELQSVADAGDIKDILMMNDVQKQQIGTKSPLIQSSELSLHISTLSLTQMALDQAQMPNPTIFMAIEFFDFELQTSELMNGPEANFDFTSVFELTVSDLFIHYLQTEGITVELYIVRDGLNYELWSQAQIPMRKLLSTQTPTQFRGTLRFLANSEGAKNGQNLSSNSLPLLGTLSYTLQVPFPLLNALSAQRRRMFAMQSKGKVAASALIPPIGGEEMAAGDTNQLVIQVHRCNGIDKLIKREGSKSKSFIAYEFFNFPVHMSKMVAVQNGTALFDDSQTWKLPADSEAVHKYLMENDLHIYVLEHKEGNIALQPSANAAALALGHIPIPLFPLSRNQKIRGTFPLISRANESIEAGASIDISIYWQFAYVYEENSQNEPKNRVKRFVPLSKEKEESAGDKNKSDQTELSKPTKKTGKTKEAKESSNQETTETVAKTAIASLFEKTSEKNEYPEASSSSEDGEEMTEEELRRQIFSIAKRFEETTSNLDGPRENIKKLGETEIRKTMEEAKRPGMSTESGNKDEEKEEEVLVEKRAEYDPDLEYAPSQEELAKAFEEEKRQNVVLSRQNSSKISEPEKMESPKSSPTEDINDEQEEDDGDGDSVRSDATYTMEKEEEEAEEKKDESKEEEEEFVIIDEDIKAKQRENEEKQEKEVEEEKPKPAMRRSLLGELPPIQPRRTMAQNVPETSMESEEDGNGRKRKDEEETTMAGGGGKKSVEFTEPLHSSIPPSDISASFSEELVSGESARSNGSGESSSAAESSESSREDATTPTAEGEKGNLEESKIKNEEAEEEKEEEKEKGRQQKEMPKVRRRIKRKTRRQINIDAVPTASAIRIRQKRESIGSTEEAAIMTGMASANGDGGAQTAIVLIRIGRLRLLEHSPLLHPEYDSAQVFVEWNFLDIERELCETDGTRKLPRHPEEQLDFEQQRAYELNHRRIALLKQWTELNIRLSFTLVLEADNGQVAGESDDLCMGELDLMEVLNANSHTLIMRNVDNMAIAVMEVGVEYSNWLAQQIRDAIDLASDNDGIIDEEV